MPIYEYQCTACGHTLEALQKMSEDALKDCPVCHKEALEKLISATSFQLKGTGWYVTDFKNKNPGDTTKGASTEKSSSSSDATSAPATTTTTTTTTTTETKSK